jgi:hypothetical protein
VGAASVPTPAGTRYPVIVTSERGDSLRRPFVNAPTNTLTRGAA